ncbi:Crp/Fnr family transcriptional regulator [Marinilactibacillus kalidii]|uniref:Crp/Fnr family transcriptional regulator n=1 Tax=Marinilactibacillus kalidii TaxID=2820274 RepID=UPI001ABEDEA3|nr:Crp/Fnr family transcriptional regulator [Marinilactibacillus kalidii]
MVQSNAVLTHQAFVTKNQEPDCINHVALFDSLTSFQKNQIKPLLHLKHYKHGENLYSPGQKADAFYIVKSGMLRIYRLGDTGKEQLIRMIPDGAFTGELALFKTGVYEAFAEAKTDCYVWSISRSDIQALLAQYPEIALYMLSTLSERLSSSEQQTAWATTETVKDRLFHFLTTLVHSKENDPIVELDMAKKELASYLGTTSESISREFSHLIKENKIAEVSCRKFKLLNFSLY